MILILWLVVGGVVGWLGAKLVGRHQGLIASVVVGIVGSFIGSLIGKAFGSANTSYLTFTWIGFGWSLLGAVILSAILNILSKNKSNV